MSDKEVWFQLYITDTGKSGPVFRVENQRDVFALAAAVYQAKDKSLGHCNAADLVFYKPGTEFPPKEKDRLRPTWSVTQDTTDENPIRVVAPAMAEQQGKSSSKLFSRSLDGICKADAPLSSLLLKNRKVCMVKCHNSSCSHKMV